MPRGAAKPSKRSAAPSLAPGAPRRALGYCRVSSVAQEEHGTSLDGQRAEVERYCALHRWPKPEMHVETESGAAEKIERRTELRRLVSAAKPGDVVIVCKVDRWSRDVPHAVQSVRDLVARGIGWISIGEGIDASTSNGDSQLGIMAWAADNERKRIKERTVGTRRRLRAEGKHVEGPAPFGYTVDTERRTLVIDEEKAAIVRDIFARIIAGESTREISQALQEEHPGVGGLDFAAIARRARNRAYLGEMRPSARKNVRAKPGDPWIKAHPPIIDRKTWTRAQAAFDGRKLNGRPVGAESRNAGYMLRGLVHCGECGATLLSHHPGEHPTVKHNGWYMCRNRADRKRARRPCPTGPFARQDVIDPQADAAALAHLADLAALLGRPDEPAHAPKAAPDFTKKRERIAAARARIVDAVAAGVFSLDDARSKLASLDAESAKIDRDEAAQEAPKPVRPRRERLAEVKALARAWGALEVAEKREAFARMTDSIVITKAKKLRIVWKAH